VVSACGQPPSWLLLCQQWASAPPAREPGCADSDWPMDAGQSQAVAERAAGPQLPDAAVVAAQRTDWGPPGGRELPDGE
jgi:hypothetical protein